MKNQATAIEATKTIDSFNYSQRKNIKVTTINEITEESPAYLIDKKMMVKLLSLFSYTNFVQFRDDLAIRVRTAENIEEVKEIMEEAIYMAEFSNLEPIRQLEAEKEEEKVQTYQEKVFDSGEKAGSISGRVEYVSPSTPRTGDDNDH